MIVRIRPLALLASAAMLSAPTFVRAETPAVTVDQRDRQFSKTDVDIRPGDTVRFENDDEFTHQIYVSSPNLNVETDEHDPGQPTDVRFPTAGDYDVRCHIHPRMLMHVHVH